MHPTYESLFLLIYVAWVAFTKLLGVLEPQKIPPNFSTAWP